MRNLTAKQISRKSTYELEERFDCMSRIASMLHTYRHVIDNDERLCGMIKLEIEEIVSQLEHRELLHYS